jgi:hypothetical protein
LAGVFCGGDSMDDNLNFMGAVRAQFFAALLIILCQNGHTQGFINLNFERATIVRDTSSPYYPYAVYASNAIPGWTPSGFLGSTEILYNDISLGAASVSIFDTSGVYPVIDGTFSIQIYGGANGAPGASISQTSLVPVSAKSILFKAYESTALGGTLSVSLGGQDIPFSALSTGSNYTLYGGDISSSAGQNQQLIFSAPPGNNVYWVIDDIQFSASAIPEPSALGLSALGALLLGWRVLRRR